MLETAGKIAVIAVIIFSTCILSKFIIKLYLRYAKKSKRTIRKIVPPFCELLCNISEHEQALHNQGLELPILNEIDEFEVNLTKVNYLDMLNCPEIKEVAIECIKKCGFGLCGPRAFFGTTEVDFELEYKLRTIFGMEAAIIYSHGFAALNSILTACKKNTVIFCDEKINLVLMQNGILANIIYFNHNDVNDLHEKLKQATGYTKKILFIEGIYAKTGSICPLPELTQLGKLYKMKIFLDESISFGVLGQRGRGVTEHFGMNPSDVDLIIGSFEGAIGSIGSFCVGSKSIIERLSTSSVPTFLAETALMGLDMLGICDERIYHLQLLSRKVHKFLKTNVNFIVHSDPVSPYKVFNYKSKHNRLQCEREIYEACRNKGVYLICNDNGLIMHLNVDLYYEKKKILNMFSVLNCAANNCGVL